MMGAGSKPRTAAAHTADGTARIGHPAAAVPPPGGGVHKLTYVYLPKHFTARDRAAVEAFVDSAGAADLVTFDGTKPVASLIPIIWDRPAGAQDGHGTGENEHGRLLGHLALANPQWRSAGPETVGLAIVHGPQAYISPSWYPSTARHGKMVPTWNYISVHFTGRLTVHRDPEWIRDVVSRLTVRHEAGRASPWRVNDAPGDFIDGQLRAIVGVEMAIATVEAKEKLSQNRNAEDRAGALDGLRHEPGAGPAAIADLMAKLPPPRR
jgi:transcriptional regulator